MISAVLLDFNGTLAESPEWMALETKRLPELALARLAAQNAIPLPTSGQLAQAQAAFRAERQTANQTHRETSHNQNLRAVLAALGWAEQVTDAQIDETVAALQRACLPGVSLLPGAAQTLADLRLRGYRLGIVSNAAYPPFLRWVLERFDLARYFEQVAISAEAGWRKPGPEIFQSALRSMNLRASATLYVGDDYEKDVAAPLRLGLAALWYRPQTAAPFPQGAQAATTITSLLEIPRWLEHNGS